MNFTYIKCIHQICISCASFKYKIHVFLVRSKIPICSPASCVLSSDQQASLELSEQISLLRKVGKQISPLSYWIVGEPSGTDLLERGQRERGSPIARTDFQPYNVGMSFKEQFRNNVLMKQQSYCFDI